MTMLTGRNVYTIWAPPQARWSPWAKPVLFAHMGMPDMDGKIMDWHWVQVPWAPSADDRTAIILDLPDVLSLNIAMALAARGYRPVPLYNGCPGRSALIAMDGLMQGLRQYTDDLMQMRIDPHAPPVFMLDSRRMPQRRKPSPGTFDNRWVVFPQDFPSGGFMRSSNVHQALVVSEKSAQPTSDLSHVLLRWQEAGMTILGKSYADDAMPQQIRVRRPPHFKMWWYTLTAMMGLRRNATGGFGGLIPVPSEGGGGFG